MVLMLWINGYRHDFSTDEGFDLVVGVAPGNGKANPRPCETRTNNGQICPPHCGPASARFPSLTASARQPDEEGKYRDSAKHRGTITAH